MISSCVPKGKIVGFFSLTYTKILVLTISICKFQSLRYCTICKLHNLILTFTRLDYLFQDYNKILTIVSSEGEIVHLERPVRAEGSVEVWLMSLLTAAQESVHCIIRQAFHFINDNQFDFLDFLGRFQAQVIK